MAVTSNQVTVGTTATEIVPVQNASFAAEREGPAALRRRVVITNTSSGTVYLGASTVTTSDGFAVAQNADVTLDLYPDEDVYGIVATGTSTAAYIATGS